VTFNLCHVTWETIAALATLAAVIVALIPVWREAGRQKAYARSLRFLLGSKLILLRPSLLKVAKGGQVKYPTAVLTKAEFREIVDRIGALLQESAVLDAGEQNAVAVALFNLEATAVLYDTAEFGQDTAKNMLKLVDEAIRTMENRPLVKGNITMPWESD
jgi:hypothetical protein